MINVIHKDVKIIEQIVTNKDYNIMNDQTLTKLKRHGRAYAQLARGADTLMDVPTGLGVFWTERLVMILPAGEVDGIFDGVFDEEFDEGENGR